MSNFSQRQYIYHFLSLRFFFAFQNFPAVFTQVSIVEGFFGVLDRVAEGSVWSEDSPLEPDASFTLAKAIEMDIGQYMDDLQERVDVTMTMYNVW